MVENREEYQRQVEECVAFLQDSLPFSPDIIIQLGTGLGHFGDKIERDRKSVV